MLLYAPCDQDASGVTRSPRFPFRGETFMAARLRDGRAVPAPHTGAPISCGFTILELLVVVAIIALLVAILIPSLSEARDQAKSAKCLANMQDMGTGMNSFAAGHRGRFQVV